MRFAACITMLIIGVTVAETAVADVCGVDEPPDPCAAASDPRQTCLTTVQRAPENINARLTLCEVLLREGELESAAVVLRDGLA